MILLSSKTNFFPRFFTKEEIIDVEDIEEKKPIEFQPSDAKKAKTDFCSEDSASLPGILVDSNAPPVGFEPGMFKQDEDSTKVKSDSGQSKPKKKKKDKKKHKHKHKHKHNKEKSKEKKESNIVRLQ